MGSPTYMFMNDYSVPQYHTGLFRVNKFIGGESWNFFYRENRFTIIKATPMFLFGRPRHYRKPSGPGVVTALAVSLKMHELKVHIKNSGKNVPERPGESRKDMVVALCHLPLVIQQIRCGRLSAIETPKCPYDARVYFAVNNPFGRDHNSSPAPLQAFEKLVRMKSISFDTPYPLEQREALSRLMLANPPAGPEILAETQALLRTTREAFHDEDYETSFQFGRGIPDFLTWASHQHPDHRGQPFHLATTSFPYDITLVVATAWMYSCLAKIKLGAFEGSAMRMMAACSACTQISTQDLIHNIKELKEWPPKGNRGSEASVATEIRSGRAFEEVTMALIKAFEVVDDPNYSDEQKRGALVGRVLLI